MVLGITGISGSGKHTAAEFFRRKGWIILDVDKIAHYLYRPYTGVWKAIVREFGENILTTTDAIDRVKLSRIVFNTSEPDEAKAALDKLNRIVHPYVKRHIKNELHRYFRRGANVAVIVALWRESGLEECCDKLLLVKADPELRSKRIQGRDGITSEIYKIRISNQNEPPEPAFIIENNGSITDLNSKLNDVIAKLVNLEI